MNHYKRKTMEEKLNYKDAIAEIEQIVTLLEENK